HHERLDGGGYPRGRDAAKLDLGTRILAVCDVYDALVSPRVYRAAWPVHRALALLKAEAGTSFDARCVDTLVRVLERDRVTALPPGHAVPVRSRTLQAALRLGLSTFDAEPSPRRRPVPVAASSVCGRTPGAEYFRLADPLERRRGDGDSGPGEHRAGARRRGQG